MEDMKVIAHASLAAFVALFAVSGAVNAEEAQQSIDFDGETYQHADHAGGAVLILDEFLRKSDTLEVWSRLVAIRRYMKETDPERAARALVATLKDNSAVLGHKIIGKQDGSEYLVDFMMQRTEPSYIFEFNIFRFVRAEGALVSYQFAYAARGSDLNQRVMADFGGMDKFQRKRVEWISMMTRVSWPVPKIEDK